MDDQGTREDLDALADLFLTGIDPADVPPPKPANQTEDRDEGDLEGAEPVRLAPKVEQESFIIHTRTYRGGDKSFAVPGVDRTADDEKTRREARRIFGSGRPSLAPSTGSSGDPGYDPNKGQVIDEVPFLRLRREGTDTASTTAHGVGTLSSQADLTPSDEASVRGSEDPTREAGLMTVAEPSSDQVPSTTLVEAVLLGNLPGLGGPWLMQYAQLVAQQDGPVAILHLDEDEIDVELVEPTAAGSGSRITVRRESSSLIALLEELVQSEPVCVQTILVHLDVAAPKSADSRLMALDQWTVLCGADDAAVLSTYRLLKRLVWDNVAASAKRVGLMVMGSDADASRAASDRIRSAASSFLRTPVELVGFQKRMGPVNVRPLGTFPKAAELWPGLRQWFGTLWQPPMETIDEGISPSEQVQPAIPGAVVEPELELATTKPSAAPDTAAPAEEAEAAPGIPDVMDPDLAGLISCGPGGIPGGIPLKARCPIHPHTQLVLDAEGRLHLLRRCTCGDQDPDAVHSLRAAVIDLLGVRRWSGQHMELLELTQRQCRFERGAEPVLHLFTDRGDLAAALGGRLGGLLKLHLLRDLRTSRDQAWFCTSLSN